MNERPETGGEGFPFDRAIEADKALTFPEKDPGVALGGYLSRIGQQAEMGDIFLVRHAGKEFLVCAFAEGSHGTVAIDYRHNESGKSGTIRFGFDRDGAWGVTADGG